MTLNLFLCLHEIYGITTKCGWAWIIVCILITFTLKIRGFFDPCSSPELWLMAIWLVKDVDDEVVVGWGELLNENSPICPKWFNDGLDILESNFLSIELVFSKEIFGAIEFGDFGWISWPLMNAEDVSFGMDMLLFLMLKNFLAFSSSSQLLAGDQIMFVFDGTDVINEVGVLGLISYEGDEGGDRLEQPSVKFRFKGEGVLLVHRSKGVSSVGLFGTDKQVRLSAIEDIILESNKGEIWLRLFGGSCRVVSKFAVVAYSDINFWYWMIRFCMYKEGINDAAGWSP